MLLPLGDSPNPPGRPYVNYLLIGINIAVFLGVSLPLMWTRPDLNDPLLSEYLRAMGARGTLPVRDILQHVSAYDLLTFEYGFRPVSPSLLTLFTSLFLHGGWMHIIGNMLFLAIFGDNVEYRLGHLGYLLVYIGTGIAATLFFGFFVPGSPIPLIGASGAISGVLGCYFLWYPRNRVKTFVFLFPFIIGNYLIPARWVLGFFLLVDNLLPFLLTRGGGSGVAHGAHIGGFLAGLGVSWLVDRRAHHPTRSSVRFSPEAEPVETAPASDDRPELISRSIAAGRMARATGLFLDAPDRASRNAVASEDVLRIGEFLLENWLFSQALAVFRRFIAERSGDPGIDRAYLGAGLAMMRQPRGLTAAYHYFLAAIDAARTPQTAEAARRQLRAIERLEVTE
ncbi:hypothetical protein JCM30471_32490 [Desulfuromonas carbonis]|uniref:rhomboid family intramembrane serine protease n=1 Tax=Desulfuromonas sp. DDH964 TaxID=1823759 RepID=UPI00078B65CA|nr:rhomboid family intramembrane serine protease [Desulfuromonas sp. DDH964]AMV71411.1 rhomboid-like membrane protein [Desulfuromonas sp. DDH964]